METYNDRDHDPNSSTERPMTHKDLYSLVRDSTTSLVFLGDDHMDMQETHDTIIPLKVPHAPILSPFETPTSRVGFPSTVGPSCVVGLWQRRMWS